VRSVAIAIVAALSLGVAGCAADAGGMASGDAAPLAVVRAAQSSLVAAKAPAKRTVRPRSVAATRSASAGAATRTASTRTRSASARAATRTASTRTRAVAPSRALSTADAPRLAAPACEQFADARGGHFPRVVQQRGSTRALALMTQAVADALLGLPVVVPDASLPAREQLDGARARLARALAQGDDATATAIARASAPRVAAYASALGIADCG